MDGDELDETHVSGRTLLPRPPLSRHMTRQNRDRTLTIAVTPRVRRHVDRRRARRAAAHASITGEPDGERRAREQVPAFALEEATIDDLQTRMRSGAETSASLVRQYLARIDAIDQRGPAINCVIELNPDADAIAAQLDTERKSGKLRGPLHGIPVLIKDNIDTADKMHTTAGSLALANNIAARDSFVAQQLRAAGAVIIGKTNLSEWANFRSTHSSSGWSGRGGQTRNPYALDRTPSGSSSGSGSAVAANCCVGRDRHRDRRLRDVAGGRGGARRHQADRGTGEPRRHHSDRAQPGHRRPDGAHGSRRRDSPRRAHRRRSARRRDGGERGTRAHRLHRRRSIATACAARESASRASISPATTSRPTVCSPRRIDLMKKHGATIVDPAEIATAGQADDSELEVLLYEFKADLNAYLGQLSPSVTVRSLADVIAFNTKNASRELKYFGQEIMEQAQAKGPLTEKKYLDALAKNRRADGQAGHRRDDREAQARRDRRADAGAGVADRSRERRSGRPGVVHVTGGRRRLSARHRADGLRARTAGRAVVRRTGVERGDAAQARVCVRAGRAGAPETDVRADGRPGRYASRA